MTHEEALRAARAALCEAIGLSQAQFATTGLDGGALVAAIDAFEATIRAALADAADLKARKDGAYLERNQVVAALAKCFPSGVARTAIEGWSEDWHGCVYIDLPTGQVSWHFHDSQAGLFDGLPPYQGQWDGHTTDEKYARLAALGDAGRVAELEAEVARLRLHRRVDEQARSHGQSGKWEHFRNFDNEDTGEVECPACRKALGLAALAAPGTPGKEGE